MKTSQTNGLRPLRKKLSSIRWINKLQNDISDLISQSGDAYKRKLKEMFGESATVQAREIESNKIHDAIKSGTVGVCASTRMLSSASN